MSNNALARKIPAIDIVSHTAYLTPILLLCLSLIILFLGNVFQKMDPWVSILINQTVLGTVLPFGLILMGLPRKNINGFYELELVIILPTPLISEEYPFFIYLFRPPFINSKVSGYTDSVFSVENSYFYFTPPTEFRIFHCIEKMLWKKRLFWVKRWKRIWLIELMQKYVRLHFSSRFSSLIKKILKNMLTHV